MPRRQPRPEPQTIVQGLARIVRWVLAVIAGAVAVFLVAQLALGQIGKHWGFPWDPQPTPATTVTSVDTAAWPLGTGPEQCDGYDREAFGDFTSETEAAVKSRANGNDAWTGAPLDGQASIDHVVPVKEAFCSGLPQGSWAAFYNDVDNLLVTTVGRNSSKGESEPGHWAKIPGGHAGPQECAWVGQWVAVKAKWRLTMDRAEFDELAAIRQTCIKEAATS